MRQTIHALTVAGVSILAAPASAETVIFDLIQIEQVIGGVGGDTTAQAIQLRMRAELQCFVSATRLIAHDATGSNPIILVDMGLDVGGCSTGDRVLIATAGFEDVLDGPLAPDFTMTNPIPASYLAAGSLTFEHDLGLIFWRLSWGGAGYSGPNNGECINDDSKCPGPGDFGPPWSGAMPAGSVVALQFKGGATDLSTTNLDHYEITDGAATFTNNAGASATVADPCPWDCDGTLNDGTVSTNDLLALLNQWGGPGGCDFDGSGAVGTTDLLKLLAHWGPCP